MRPNYYHNEDSNGLRRPLVLGCEGREKIGHFGALLVFAFSFGGAGVDVGVGVVARPGLFSRGCEVCVCV